MHRIVQKSASGQAEELNTLIILCTIMNYFYKAVTNFIFGNNHARLNLQHTIIKIVYIHSKPCWQVYSPVHVYIYVLYISKLCDSEYKKKKLCPYIIQILPKLIFHNYLIVLRIQISNDTHLHELCTTHYEELINYWLKSANSINKYSFNMKGLKLRVLSSTNPMFDKEPPQQILPKQVQKSIHWPLSLSKWGTNMVIWWQDAGFTGHWERTVPREWPRNLALCQSWSHPRNIYKCLKISWHIPSGLYLQLTSKPFCIRVMCMSFTSLAIKNGAISGFAST